MVSSTAPARVGGRGGGDESGAVVGKEKRMRSEEGGG
jgi:hypothetical protein